MIERLEGPCTPRPAETRDPERPARLVQPLHGRGRRLVSDAGKRSVERGQSVHSRARRWTRSSRPKSKGREPTPDPLDVLFEFLIEEKGTIGTIYAHHTEKRHEPGDDRSRGARSALTVMHWRPKDRCAGVTRTREASARFRGCWVNTSAIGKMLSARRGRPEDDVAERRQGRAARARTAAPGSLPTLTVFDPEARHRSVDLPRAVSV